MSTPGEKKAWKSGFKKGAESVTEGLPGWFGTFADMMTLLFAFFVLLAALSTMDPVKIQEMANSTGKSLGSKIKMEGAAELEGEFEKKMDNLLDVRDSLQEMVEKIKKEMEKEGKEGDPPIDVTTSPKGVTLNVSGDFSFKSGSASLKQELKDLLKNEIAPKITNSIFQIEVAGHSDNDKLPGSIRKKFPSNWELSASRGAAVIRHITTELGDKNVDPRQLIAAGYAQYVPRGKAEFKDLTEEYLSELNATNEQKGKNRRIEITFLKPTHHKADFVEGEE
ncbi:MAG: flagellar motor protein MotB [Candidatus Marinimicrobia bacterium]|nr:flagellar motor protein MotB [Candidatus Neomarinimicrobiota bacterium]MBT3937437.1 flagellar motor protein MotB [Candidatus Neomarinimicrobiota bacterium]MBT3961293.1 flagellar motor protein MotB [Candidatus Neomarinimicrobiota bacterium]MBT4383088.1 flagellar motor protein MotB [Candidatus Neomarinimicrobiota bacterium]MBT4635558.1 flagellar motor protein MotB [Candidatus Neomarinimicrobiota bacterium]